MLKFILKLFSVFLLALILLFNYSLYYQPSFSQTKATYNEDVYHQLLHLKNKLRQGAGEEMQRVFPEGFIFINVLYGLSWSDLIKHQPKSSNLYQEGIQEVSWAVKEIISPKAKSIFPTETPLKYGAFYRGWSNYLLGSKLKVQAKKDRLTSDIELFQKNCLEISQALQASGSPYLETYSGQKWPADGIIAVSSLKLHDQVFSNNHYEEQLSSWIKQIKLKLDDNTGLIPHSVDTRSDETIEGARGCSQSLILNFIKDIDSAFAFDQFAKYQEHFLDYRIGMPGVREYPKGIKGYGDIDSGPVIFDIGGAASIVGQRSMAQYRGWKTYRGLRNSIESFGVGMTFNDQKFYLLGQLPMADAFIVWSNSIETFERVPNEAEYWRLKVHLLSFFLLGFFAYPIFKL